ncbi:MAG: LamG domain-containing protein [Sedimentisphaerales bacterium]|nr:LamG domain-containing protein [Sedimentisphaerales bacterium]
MASDASGNSHDGTLLGDPQWVVGRIGGALDFNGTDSMIDIPYSSEMTPTQGTTMAAWVFPTDTSRSCIVGQYEGYGMALMTGLQLKSVVWGADWVLSDVTIPEQEWSHVAMTWDVAGSERMIFLNGETVGQRGDAAVPNVQNNMGIGLWVGWPASWGDDSFMGILDDVQIHDLVLTEDEIKVIIKGQGYPYALGPDPKDGALHEATWVTLGWSAGDYAVSHDVYLGDNFDEVSTATPDSDVFRGNQAATFYVAGFPGFAYPDGLVPGTTYYWRIDEVNDTDPNSPWKGPVWSFSIPPKTAYYPDPADGAEFVGPDDVTLSWTAGFGSKLHTVYFGDNFDDVNDAAGGAPMGLTIYHPGPLEREKAYYWRVDEFDAVATYKGNVWSFTTPGSVGHPQPAYGTTDVPMNATLSWTPADSAASHQLYFGTDKEIVRNADTGSPEDKGSMTLGEETYDPGLLEPQTTYYWRVDEIDSQGNASKGPLWSFTTGNFLLVEDFESYTDDDVAGQAIWQSWIDGFGIADNGAQVGYLLPPYAERTIVHGGSQSMPLLYANENGVTNSEASMMLTTLRDWTQTDVAELSLWFRGSLSNAVEPLYVSISNSARAPVIVAHDDPSIATVNTWSRWVIPLQAFADQGINLSAVDKLAIGLGTTGNAAAPGGSGTLYIDDIRLYQP